MAKESFATLFERGEIVVQKARALRPGDEVEGVVVHIGSEAVFVDLDDKQQAFFDRLELEAIDPIDGRAKLHVAVGDRLRGRVVSVDNGQVRLARRLGKGEVSTEHLAVAFQSGVAVEGRVAAVNKGGVEVELAGVRAFCPISQLDEQRVEDANGYVGRTLAFLVTRLDGRDVVVSRRALLEREAKEARERALSALSVGVVTKGRVTQVRDFGVFVDLGGIEGLVPLRELSHERVRAEDVVRPGDVLEVQVKDVARKHDAKGREKVEITLSVKSLARDPWEGIEAIAPVGRVVAGQVTRMTEFGAFVRLAEGVEGLLHVSELSGADGRTHVERPDQVLSVGQPVLARVLSVDPSKRRVSLALASEGASVGALDEGGRVVLGAIVEAVVDKVEGFGVVVQIRGIRGRAGRAVVPNAETATRPGTDLRKEFPVGKAITAKVVDATEGRVRLSIRAALEDAERANYDAFRASASSVRLGTLGDLLEAKLGKK